MAVYQNRTREMVKRLILLRDYLHTNASPTHAVKAKDMLDFLESKDIEIKIKTLYSDLTMLETYFKDVKLDYDPKEKGYVLYTPPLSSYDLRLIVNSVQAAQFITQEEANRLTDRIMGLADEYIKTMLDRRTFVVNRARTMDNSLIEKLDIIYEAIAQNKKINYKYHINGSDEYVMVDGSKTIIASPVGIVWTGKGYLLITARKTGEKVSKYMLKLDDVEKIGVQPDTRDDVSSVCKFYEDFQGICDEGEDDDWVTKLKVSNAHAPAIAEKLGHDATITQLDANYFLATISTYPTPELYMWAVSFDPCIEIVYPPDAEDELRGYFSGLANGGYVPPPYP